MADSPVRAVIFDLDGTLVQTRVASWEIFQRIDERFGLGVDRPEKYFELFNGNVFRSIRRLCRDDAQADQVNAAFLELLRTEYTPPLVPGVADVVRRLASDCTLAVMSSNAMAVLRRVLVANDLAFCFAHVFGGDVAPDKKTAMRSFLADAGNGYGRRCAADYDEAAARQEADPASTVLVTDTAGDVKDARAVGIRAVGVAWGMHSVAELTDAGAEFVALWPQEIAAHLLGDQAARPPRGACAVPAVHPPARRPGEHSAVAGGRIPGEQNRPGGCGCGCDGSGCPVQRFVRGERDPVREAASARRRRRQQAAAAVSAPPRSTRAVPMPVPVTRPAAAPSDELLAAVRRVCHG
ncbi:HAD family hydrolase [Nakamurella sp.]|uniref:HAD family hydrolase n=1 Tax=Nakamurella sp. TaxID=1869182 RepID=UPI003783D2F1